jgi:hypothetical protein
MLTNFEKARMQILYLEKENRKLEAKNSVVANPIHSTERVNISPITFWCSPGSTENQRKFS